MHNKHKTELSSFGYNQELDRSLNLFQLTAFGLNYMIPIAPAIVFGSVMLQSGGTVSLPYILSLFGMLFTAMSYVVLLKNFPLSGSVYNYVSRGISPGIGFIAGWAVLLDYLIIPSVTAASAAIYLQQLFQNTSYFLWLVLFVAATSLLNLIGIKPMAKLGIWLLIVGELVVFAALFSWAGAVTEDGVGVGTLFSWEPFHFSNWQALASATSIAMLSYLGFDAISTLAEEAINPFRDIPRAIYLSLIIGAFTMSLTGYLGMLVIPNWREHIHDQAWIDSILFHVTLISGGKLMSILYAAGFILAMGVFNIVATASCSRILYAMGRDNILPKSIFGTINPKNKVPQTNIILIMCAQLILGASLSINLLSSLVNFGAVTGFILLNISVIWLYYVKKSGISPCMKQQSWKPSLKYSGRYLLAPLLGITVMFWIASGLNTLIIYVGCGWIILGVFIYRLRLRAFNS